MHKENEVDHLSERCRCWRKWIDKIALRHPNAASFKLVKEIQPTYLEVQSCSV